MCTGEIFSLTPMLPGERFNTYTHLFGVGLSLLGLVLVLAKTLPDGDTSKIVGGVVFTLSSAALYASSTVFHSTHGSVRAWWQRADHCAIYVLIAGSYTPFALAVLKGPWCWVALSTVWGVSIFGAVHEARSRLANPSVALYLGLGWLVVAAVAPLLARIETGGLWWLLVGAGSYTVGTVFYINRSGYSHAHGIWHLFVLGGTTSHFVAIAAFVL